MGGYQGFGTLVAALESNGIDLSGADCTLFAPVDSAFVKHEASGGSPITADLLKYHVVEGKTTKDSIAGDITTLQGGVLKYSRRFRKTWLNDSIIDLNLKVPQRVRAGHL